MAEDQDNVIHVAFGKDGARRVPAPDPAAPPDSVPPPREKDPLADLYTARDVARLFSLSSSRLRYWARTGFIRPSGKTGRRPFYTFQDLISLRVAKGLLEQGVPLRAVRRSVEALRRSLPRVTRPLSELRVIADGQTVLVQGDGASFEPTTGQLVLDFAVQSLRDDVVRVLAHPRQSAASRKVAYERYLEGCRLDEDDATVALAEDAYRDAIRLDPSLSNALTNLGNLRFRRGYSPEAELLYRRALEIDPSQPEAHYNLGFICFERGDTGEAVRFFGEALVHDPGFADAHFNLAMALEDLGDLDAARPHWETYLRLDPSGPWAAIAERHLAQPRA